MNYQETIDYLYQQLPMFSRIGKEAIKPGFANIIALCEQLNIPYQKNKYIHIAGTNGKGSVSHMLASILQTGGYKTGLYTSPHLKDFKERIRVNGVMMEEDEVVAFVAKAQSLIESLHPSFFEITVAMALYYFDKCKTDIAVIETGLGGRLDSTNIITPELSIITNIGYDHMQMLGDTLEKIATEKAGIIKPHIPVVIGEKQEETSGVFVQKAAEQQAPITFATEHFQIANWQSDNHFLKVEVAIKDKTDHQAYLLDLTGQYQLKNLLTVLESCRQMQQRGWNISERHIAEGLKHVKKHTGLQGRWEVVHQHPQIVLDVAHNVNGIQELLNQLEITSYHHLHMVIGMVKDKDVDQVLKMLPPYATYYFTNAHIPRALSAETLKAKAAHYNLQGKCYSSVDEAIAEAKAHAHTNDLIVVCGSVFLVGEVSRI